MLPTLILSSFVGVTLPEEVVDRLVSTRTVVVQRQVMLKFAILTGDPLGDRSAGTIKALAEPHMTALHKQTATFMAGRLADALTGQTSEGIEIKVTPRIQLDGKVYVECETSLHTVNTGRGITTAAGFVPGVDTQMVKTNAALKPGETLKVRLSAKSATDQTWIEMSATIVEDPRAAFAAEAAKMTWSITDTATVVPATFPTLPGVVPPPPALPKSK